MQHLASNSGPKEGKLGGPSIENGASSSIIHKYKRRKVSAVRDFPPKCGRFSPQCNGSSMEAGDSVGNDKSLSDALKTGAVLEADFVKASVPAVESCSPEVLQSSAREEVLKSSNDLDPNLGKSMDLANSVGSVGNGKSLLDGSKSGAVLGDSVEASVPAVESHSSEVLQSPVRAEVLKPSNDLESNVGKSMDVDDSVDKPELVNVESGGKELHKSSDDEGLIDSLKSSEHETFELSKDSGKVDIGSPIDNMAMSNNLEVKSPEIPSTNSSALEKIVTKKYPRRRRISAVRDFPPLCGRERMGQKNSCGEDKFLKETVRTNVQLLGEDVQGEDHLKSKFKAVVSKNSGDNVQAECEGDNTKEVGKMEKKNAVCDGKVGGLEEEMEKEIAVYNGEGGGSEGEVVEEIVVQGLMAAPNCPWREGNRGKLNPAGCLQGSKGKKRDLSGKEKSKSVSRARKTAPRYLEGKSMKKKSSSTVKTYHGTYELVVRDEVNSPEHGVKHGESQLGSRSRDYNVTLPPSVPLSSSGKGDDHDGTVTRNKVRETLRLFQAVCRKLLQEEEAKPKGENTCKRIDLQAAKILKDKNLQLNTDKQILGSVPGVEVGDEFQFRVELAIVGLHRLYQAGIDYVKQNKEVFAASIVASGGYADDLDSSDVLIYTGSGGNVVGPDKKYEDQKLERGNLALKNSIIAKNPVRVIRGFETKDKSSERAKTVKTYTYDGLYLVEKYWQEIGPHDKLVYKFQLGRIPGQPELAWNVVKKSKKSQTREGLCVDDISQGKELTPICAVNTVDNEKPPPFNYITGMMYPDYYSPVPPQGCDCTAGCLDSKKCSCAVRNGGEIPFNYNGAIVEAKPLVYECGPCCKCPSSCRNRVSQHGIKFQLEIFKTESRGWGVRSLNSIPSGSFICEYLGELLDDKEAEQRTGSDEYLFDIGQNYNDHTLWDGLSNLMPDAPTNPCSVVEDVGFTIDAAQYGNVGRFINHSCSPNLYAQNVLYDQEDKRMPHIMLFAAENIPPLQELAYHYNYTIDQVYDSEGNIKKKNCYCGSSDCSGRMY